MSRTGSETGQPTIRTAFVTQWFAPEFVLVVMSIAESLRTRGHHLRVLTGVPNFPSGQVQPGYRAWKASHETIAGFEVRRTPLYPSHDSSAIRRIANYLSWAISATIFGSHSLRKADVALVYSSPATAALPAMLWKWVTGTPYVLLVQDVWPDSVVASGFVPNPWRTRVIHRLLNWFVNWSYRSAQHIVVISPGMMELLESRGVPSSKLSLMFNWSHESETEPISNLPDIRSLYGIPSDAFVVTYAGNHGAVQGLDVVVRAASRLSGEATFLFVGDGLEHAALVDLASSLECSNVHFVGSVPHSQIASIQAASDIQLISLIDDPLFAITMPSKVQAILSSGRATVAVAAGDVARVVDAAGAGWAVAPGDIDNLEATIRNASRVSTETLTEMGESGRRYYYANMSESIGSAHLDSVLRNAARSRRNKTIPGDQL